MAAAGAEKDEIVEVHARPRAKRNRVAGRFGNGLKVEVTAPPVDGRANAAVAEALAAFFGVRRAQVEMVSGAASKAKRFRIAGLTRQALLSKMSGLPK